LSNAPSKPVSFSRPKVGYFSNRPRIAFLTTALEGVRGQRHAPAALYPGKNLIPTVQVFGWAPGPVWTGLENLTPTGIRSPDHPARSSVAIPTELPGPQLTRGLLKIKEVA